jgi:hypothetical protein
VFGQDRAGIIDIAVTGAKLIGDLASAVPDTEIIHQFLSVWVTKVSAGFVTGVRDRDELVEEVAQVP